MNMQHLLKQWEEAVEAVTLQNETSVNMKINDLQVRTRISAGAETLDYCTKTWTDSQCDAHKEFTNRPARLWNY